MIYLVLTITHTVLTSSEFRVLIQTLKNLVMHSNVHQEQLIIPTVNVRPGKFMVFMTRIGNHNFVLYH